VLGLVILALRDMLKGGNEQFDVLAKCLTDSEQTALCRIEEVEGGSAPH